jgi:hypothetical protein
VLAIVAAAVGSLAVAVAFAGFTQDSDTRAVPYNTTADANANCGRKHVNFGGFKADTPSRTFVTDQRLWPSAMAPNGNDTDKWSAVASNDSFKEGRITSIAYCKGGAEPKVKRKTEIILPSAANNEARTAEVACPGDKYVIGGGWSARTGDPLAQDQLGLMGLERTANGHNWKVSVYNATGAQQRLTAIALCANRRTPTTKKTTVDVHEGDDATATAECPRGKEVVFGGLRAAYNILSGKNNFVRKFFLAGDDQIKVYGFHNTVAPGFNDVSYLTAIAYCR